MPAPTDDPIILQIMNALCAALRKISQTNGFYNDVAGVGIEPLAFNKQDSYPQIVVQEESGEIADSTPAGYQGGAVLAAIGFVPITPGSGYATALKLRDDMTRVMRSITKETFKGPNTAPVGYVPNGKQIVREWSIDEKREIVNSELAEGFLEVIVRAAVDYRDFSPPVSGI